MHFARPSFQQSQIGNVITRPKKDWCIIIGNMAACLSSLLSLPFPPQTPFSRWIAPRLFVVALLQIRHYDAAVPTSGVPRGLRTVSGSAPPSTLPIRPIPCLSSVLDILLSTILGFALCTCNSHFVRGIFSIGFANLIYPPRRVSWPKWS